MLSLPVVRRRLEAQGFLGLDDVALAEIGPWLRWSPALCAAFMAAGTIFASAPALVALAGIAAVGAVTPAHPFDLVYNHLVRRFTRTRPLPRNAAQRRFACGVASVWLAGTALAFHEGAPGLGDVLGGILTLAAGVMSVTHFCVLSLVYGAVSRRRAGRVVAVAGQ